MRKPLLALIVTKSAWGYFNRREKLNIYALSFGVMLLAILDLLAAYSTAILFSKAINVDSSSLTKSLELIGFKEITFYQLTAITVVLYTARMTIGLYLVRTLLLYLAKVATKTSQRILFGFTQTKYEYLRNASIEKSGWVLTDGVNALIIGVIGNWIIFLGDTVTILLMSASLLVLNPGITLSAVIYFTIISFILLNLVTPRVKNLASLNGDLSADTRKLVRDFQILIPEFPNKFTRDQYIARVTKTRSEGSNLYAKLEWFQSIPKYVIEVAGVFGIVGGIVYFNTTQHQGSYAFYGLFIAAFSRILPAVIRIQGTWLSLIRNFGYSSTLLETIKLLTNDEKDSFADGNQLIESTQVKSAEINRVNFQRLALEEVSFSYPGSDVEVLNGISVQFIKGETVAIVGNSGGGKTTLGLLLLGLFSPTDGKILLDNRKLSEVELVKGFLPQSPYLFDGSIFHNVTLSEFRNQINEEKLRQSLIEAGCIEFVENLPNGPDTEIRSGGMHFSGGQAQRLALARVLYSNPDVIVYDEPTSALDALNDQLVLQTILARAKNSLTFIIAHRYSTLKNVDKVLYISNGGVKAFGTWNEVYESCSEFREQALLQGLIS